MISLRRTRPDLTDARFSTVDVDVVGRAGAVIVRREHTAILLNPGGASQQFPGSENSEPVDILLAFGEHTLDPGGLVLDGHSLAVIDQTRGD